MNHFNASRQPMPAQRPSNTPESAAARKLAEDLMDAMSALLGLIERETELVRAGKVREAMAMEAQKQELSRRYVGAVSQLKANQAQLAKSAPELLSTLHRHHDRSEERRARRQCRDPEAQRAEHLYGGGAPRHARPAPHHSARGQPLALSARITSDNFTKNRAAISSRG